MCLRRLVKFMERLYVEKSGSDKIVSYFRRKGMKIGDRCQLNTMAFSDEPYLIELGNDVAIALNTAFITHDGGIRCFNEYQEYDIFGRIKIGNNVFIGEKCVVLLNTVIGNNCIVGAGSVVRGRFPDNSVILGNPAKIVASMNVQKLLYHCNPGRLPTGFMTDDKKRAIVIKNLLSTDEN